MTAPDGRDAGDRPLPPGLGPPTLDRDGIARRIPHAGRMCLLDRLERWDAEAVQCSAVSHRQGDHPLALDGVLWAPSAIEYAAQAMALHGGLIAPAKGGPSAGYIASVRAVRLHVLRIDTVAGPLRIHAQRLAGDQRQVMYAFRVTDQADQPLVEGRAAVVLNTPLPAPAGAAVATPS